MQCTQKRAKDEKRERDYHAGASAACNKQRTRTTPTAKNHPKAKHEGTDDHANTNRKHNAADWKTNFTSVKNEWI